MKKLHTITEHIFSNNKIIKFSDDTIIMSLLKRGDCISTYHREISSFLSWCNRHHLTLNANKTKEMVIDPRDVQTHDPVVIGKIQIEQVESFKYLGVNIDNRFKWNIHVDYICSKFSQRLYFLRRLRLFGVSTKIMSCFYNAVLESLIRYSMAAWFGSLTVQCKAKLGKLVHKAMKVMGRKEFPTLQDTFKKSVLAQAKRIIGNPLHLLNSEYELLPSGRRYRAHHFKSNRYKLSFVPNSVSYLNKVVHQRRT